MLIFWVFAVAAALLLLGFVWLLKNPDTEGSGRPDCQHWERCGGSLDGMALTIPLVEVCVRSSEIMIVYLGKTIRIAYDDINSVEDSRVLLAPAVRIVHRRKDLPNEILLVSRDCARLRQSILRNIVAP